MRKLTTFLIALGAMAFAQSADAATCFWVGTGGAPGGGTYSTTNGVNWASSSNGANSSCAATGGVPKNAGDVATFDSAANGIGSNTVTLDSSMNNASIATITIPTGTGTLSTNGQNLTLTTQFSMAASGATINCGSSTFTFTGANTNNWIVSAGTVACGSGTFVIAASATSANQTFAGGGNSYGTLTVSARSGNADPVVITGSNTFANVNLNAPAMVAFTQATTTTISNAFNWAGSSSNQLFVTNNSPVSVQVATIAVGAASTISWAAIRGITFTTNTVTATNSFDLKGNTGVTITPPSGGGGGIIGGGL